MFYMEAVMKIIHTADWHLGKNIKWQTAFRRSSVYFRYVRRKNERRRT